MKLRLDRPTWRVKRLQAILRGLEKKDSDWSIFLSLDKERGQLRKALCGRLKARFQVSAEEERIALCRLQGAWSVLGYVVNSKPARKGEISIDVEGTDITALKTALWGKPVPTYTFV